VSANIIHGAYRVKGESYIKGCGPSLSDGRVSAAPEL